MQARKRFAQSHVEFAMVEQTHRFLFGKAVRMARIAARSQIRDIGAGGRGTSTSENARSERSKIPFGGN
jgi:hypothetical protein